MGCDYSRAAVVQASLRELSPGQLFATISYFFLLSLAAAWTFQQVWFPVDLPSSVPWELLCVAEEVMGRKCIVAVGGLVHKGRYLLAVGGSTMGVISVGQVAVGIISVGWLACGVFLAAGISAVASCGLVCGLVAFGGHSPACIVGFTLLKTPRSEGVLNFAAVHLPGITAAPAGPYRGPKAKGSPRVQQDEEDGEQEEHSEGGTTAAVRRHAQRQDQQQEEEEWPHTHRYSRYASGA